LSEALMAVYKLFWDEFSSWYLEMAKPAYQQPIDRTTYEATLGFFDSLLKVLHPFMPFITEELWQALEERKDGESIMVEMQPIKKRFGKKIIEDIERVKEIISAIRNVRKENNISNKIELELWVKRKGRSTGYDSLIKKMCLLSNIKDEIDENELVSTFIIKTTRYALPLGDNLDIEAELEKLQNELNYIEDFIESVMKKLGNERFVANAKPEVVEAERKKKADAESKIASLKEGIEALKK